MNCQPDSMRGVRFLGRWTALLGCTICLGSSGCTILHPKMIRPDRHNLPPGLSSPSEPQMERGQERPIIDGIGWVFGIPSKIILWNRKSENHHISPETEARMQEYLAVNGLAEVKVRLNQYRPLDDWRRLTRNKSVAWPWRYTAGTLSVLGETVVPGRLFGGDHYNPFTGTIHLYSDLPSVALHESAHAKDFARRRYPGTYAVLYAIPFVPLYHESVATNDVLAYIEFQDDQELKEEAYRVLYPAYGTYVGNSMGYIFPDLSTPLYAGGIVAGHAIGRWRLNHQPKQEGAPYEVVGAPAVVDTDSPIPPYQPVFEPAPFSTNMQPPSTFQGAPAEPTRNTEILPTPNSLNFGGESRSPYQPTQPWENMPR